MAKKRTSVVASLNLDARAMAKERGGFNAPTRAYKKNPSMEHYVKLRRADPAAEIEVAVIGGFEQLLFMQPELEKYDFKADLIVATIDADPEAISEVSLQIMEKILEARKLAKEKQTQLTRRGLAIPDKLVNWLIASMLDALSRNDDLYIPRDLIVLIRERLGGSNTEYEQASSAHQKRNQAILIGGQIKARGGKPSFRMLARALKVSPSTVMRWFSNGDFQKEVEGVAAWFDENGEMRGLKDAFRRPLQAK